MEFSKILDLRRSIREYKENTSISREDVETIIRTAQLAPSWKNSQTARYYVVMSPEKLVKVKENCLPESNRRKSANAPVLIVTAFEKGISGFNTPTEPTNELGDEWGAYDLGLQNQLLLLKASELGYDTLIMGMRNADALRAELSIPETQKVVAVIALGKRDIDPSMPNHKPLDEILKIF